MQVRNRRSISKIMTMRVAPAPSGSTRLPPLVPAPTAGDPAVEDVRAPAPTEEVNTAEPTTAGDSAVEDVRASAPTEEANAAESAAAEPSRGTTAEGPPEAKSAEENDAAPEPGRGAAADGAAEAKGEEDDAESGAAPAPPANATLLEACYHPGVTMEALQARGSEAAAKEKATEEKYDEKYDEYVRVIVAKGSTPLHCLCMNVMVTLEMLRYVCDLWPDAAKEKDAVRARPSPRRERAPSRRVTPRSLSRFVRSLTARLCTSCARTRTRPPR